MKWPDDYINKVICGDCLAVMEGMPDGCVDHVITDPPYGDVTHEGARTANQDTHLIDFGSISVGEFSAYMSVCVKVSSRWVLASCDWRHAAHAEDYRLPVVRCGVWVKPNGAPQFSGDRPGTGWEAVLILHRKGKKRWNGGGHRAVWIHNICASEHPTGKPLPLLLEWIEQFTDPGDIVLDPFCGSGTTLVAAKMLGRKYIGIEIEEKYCKIAEERLRNTTPPLPFDVTPEMKQENLL